MREHTYVWQEISITLGSPTVRDKLYYDVVFQRLIGLAELGTALHPLNEYARFVTSFRKSSKPLPFNVPSASASAEDLFAGMTAWLDAEGDFYERWRVEYALTTATPNGAHLQPDIDPNA